MYVGIYSMPLGAVILTHAHQLREKQVAIDPMPVANRFDSQFYRCGPHFN